MLGICCLPQVEVQDNARRNMAEMMMKAREAVESAAAGAPPTETDTSTAELVESVDAAVKEAKDVRRPLLAV